MKQEERQYLSFGQAGIQVIRELHRYWYEMRKLDISGIFKSEADKLIKTRSDSIRIHGTGDIKAAGNEIEGHVRSIFRRMLPKNIYVTHGHLIDENGLVSPQLDIIIADTINLPSLMTTNDGTEYVPIDSVYCYGEIKSTYHKNYKYIEYFSDVIKKINEEMSHEIISNTAFSEEITDDTIMRDLILDKRNRYLNKIMTFMLVLDKGDFEFEDIKELYKKTDNKNLPDINIILNEGTILHGKVDGNRFTNNRYPG